MRISWAGAALVIAAAMSPFARSAELPAGKALLFCDFESSNAPCRAGSVRASSVQLSDGKQGHGLHVCKGDCEASSRIDVKGGLSMQRGTVAFWLKLNKLGSSQAPMDLFSTYPGKPLVNASVSAGVARTVELVTPGSPTVIWLPKHAIQNNDLIRITGAGNTWTDLNGEWKVHRINEESFSIPLDSNHFGRFRGNCTVLQAAAVTFTYEPGQSFQTDPFFLTPGDWHHFVWTWNIDRHRVYRDGHLVRSYSADSPFPYVATFPALTIGSRGNSPEDLTLDNFGSYDFTFTDREVEAVYASKGSDPLKPIDSHGLKVTAEWGPGRQKVKVSIDSGNDHLGQITRFEVSVLRDGQPVANTTFSSLHQGYVEGLIDVHPFESGTYKVVVKGVGGAGPVGGAESEPWPFEKPFWLANTYGITDKVPQPYWDPITVSGHDLTVVHRRYTFTGGFGLPVQMNSLGKNILSRPVTLELRSGQKPLALQHSSLEFTETKPNEVQWQGKASADSRVLVSTKGRLDYDGMLLVTIRLEPAHGPVPLDGIRLNTTLTDEAAKYVFASKDQPYWTYVWSIRPPRSPGEFNNNLSKQPQRQHTDNIFSVVFSDDDRGLQIFHNNMAGWQIDVTKPWQRFIREADGSVTYRCDLANEPFTLREPVEITVGWMATPTKRLPPDWRLATGGGSGVSAAPNSPYEYTFDFSLGHTWRTFYLLPTDLAGFKTSSDTARNRNRKVLPFVNAHLLLATSPATSEQLATLKAETLNTNWDSSPSRGMADYWAWAMNRLINDSNTPNVVDGYYIDESYGFLPNTSLLNGAGYIQADGTHGYGINLLDARDMYIRLAKILMEAGKPPNLWFHVTGGMYPQMWSHGMITLDGERASNGFYVRTDTPKGDHFDAWNDNNSILDPNQPSRYGTWLLGLSQARKFGFIPIMWRGLQCCERQPYFEDKQRKAECLYQMHDIVQADQRKNWWEPKFLFGIGEPDVTFHEYMSQSGFTTSDPNLKVTYYQRPNSILAYIANFGSADVAGRLTMDMKTIDPHGSQLSAKDAESGAALEPHAGVLNLTVGYHNCRVVQFDLH